MGVWPNVQDGTPVDTTMGEEVDPPQGGGGGGGGTAVGGLSKVLSSLDFRALPDGNIAGTSYGSPTTFTNGDGSLDPAPTYDNSAFGNPAYQRAKVIAGMFRHDLVSEGTLAAVIIAPRPGTDLSSGKLTVAHGPVYRDVSGVAVFDTLAQFTEGGAVVINNVGHGFVMSCHYRNDGEEARVTYNAKVNRGSGAEVVMDGTLEGETDQTGVMDLDWSAVPTGTKLELRRNGVLIDSYIDLASGGEFVDTSTLGAATASIICETPEFPISSQIRWIALTPSGQSLATLGADRRNPTGVIMVTDDVGTVVLTAPVTTILLDATEQDVAATLPVPSPAMLGWLVTAQRYDGSANDATITSSGPSGQALGRLVNSAVTWACTGSDWVLINNFPE